MIARSLRMGWIALASFASVSCGADIRVGADVATIADAIDRAGPGDTIHLEPRVYYEIAQFVGKHGEPGSPIVLDGHGATLNGSNAINPAGWREIEPGLFATRDLVPEVHTSIIDRWFFLWDGRPNHMGRTAKGRKAPFKVPAELQPGEWTFLADEHPETSSSRRISGEFFVKLPPGQKLAEARIAAPVRSAGVMLRGENTHLVIRNLTATHVYNDGFNIHGNCRDVVFENIAAIECGDDGISGHGTAEYQVSGIVSIGNSTGITDIGASCTNYDRVLIAECLAYDLYFWEHGRHRLRNAIILSSAEKPFVVEERNGQGCTVELENVFFRRLGTPANARFDWPANVRATRVTFDALGITGSGAVTLLDSIIDGRPDRQGDCGADELALLRIVPRPPPGMFVRGYERCKPSEP